MVRSVVLATVVVTVYSTFSYNNYSPTCTTTDADADRPYCWPTAFKTTYSGGAANCAGKKQSPINIAQATPSTKLELPKFSSKTTACLNVNFFNNAHSLEASLEQCGYQAEFNGTEYELDHIQLHSPSEHTVGGASFDGELQMVHKSKAGAVMVVGVLLNSPSSSNGATPATNSFIDKFLGLGVNPLTGKANPTTHAAGFDTKSAGEVTTTFASENSFDPYGEVLPADPTFYSYTGSLTAPPCTEEVRWLVMAQPVSVSSSQMQAVRTHLSKANSDKTNLVNPATTGQYRNDRPVQALNGRAVTIEFGAAQEVENEHAAAEHAGEEHHSTFWYSSILHPVGEFFGFVGVVVLTVGGFVAFLNLGVLGYKQATGREHMSAVMSNSPVSLSVVRVQFAKSVILSLEILVAADVIDTLAKPVASQTFTQLGLISMIVVIRTILALHLGHELHSIKMAHHSSHETQPLTQGSSSSSSSSKEHSNPGVQMGDMSGL